MQHLYKERDSTAGQTKGDVSHRYDRKDLKISGDLREGLLQPSSSGANDFSKGTEGLAQKILRGETMN